MAEAATITPIPACLPACLIVAGVDPSDIVALDRIGDQVAGCPDWTPYVDDTGEPRRPSPVEMFAYCLGRARRTRAAHEAALPAFIVARLVSPAAGGEVQPAWQALADAFRDRVDAAQRFASLPASTSAEMALKRESIDAAWIKACHGERFELIADLLHEEWQTFEADAISLEAEWNQRALMAVEA